MSSKSEREDRCKGGGVSCIGVPSCPISKRIYVESQRAMEATDREALSNEATYAKVKLTTGSKILFGFL